MTFIAAGTALAATVMGTTTAAVGTLAAAIGTGVTAGAAGAGLGAIGGAITGGDVGQAALMGGVSGMVGGALGPALGAAGVGGATMGGNIAAGGIAGAAGGAAGSAAGGEDIGKGALIGGAMGGIGGAMKGVAPTAGGGTAQAVGPSGEVYSGANPVNATDSSVVSGLAPDVTPLGADVPIDASGVAIAPPPTTAAYPSGINAVTATPTATPTVVTNNAPPLISSQPLPPSTAPSSLMKGIGAVAPGLIGGVVSGGGYDAAEPYKKPKSSIGGASLSKDFKPYFANASQYYADGGAVDSMQPQQQPMNKFYVQGLQMAQQAAQQQAAQQQAAQQTAPAPQGVAQSAPAAQPVQAAANGGIMHDNLGGYSHGGIAGLTSAVGSGVSDDIPAQIGNSGKQPARLAANEFVIPARAVSELGQGSSEAGAKQLQAMVDRIQAGRKKSIGKGKIAVDSKAVKNLPA